MRKKAGLLDGFLSLQGPVPLFLQSQRRSFHRLWLGRSPRFGSPNPPSHSVCSLYPRVYSGFVWHIHQDPCIPRDFARCRAFRCHSPRSYFGPNPLKSTMPSSGALHSPLGSFHAPALAGPKVLSIRHIANPVLTRRCTVHPLAPEISGLSERPDDQGVPPP